jgi:hypothetical protein
MKLLLELWAFLRIQKGKSVYPHISTMVLSFTVTCANPNVKPVAHESFQLSLNEQSYDLAWKLA